MRNEYIQPILDYLKTHGTLSTQKAQKLLHVSEATVRRVFAYMALSGSVRRQRGGVSLPDEADKAIPFQLRTQWLASEKELLAQKALSLLKPEAKTFIHNGSTTLFLGKYITQGTFITDSVSLADLLIRRYPGETGPQVILCGGLLDRRGGMTFGYHAERTLADFQADYLITSASGADLNGPMDVNEQSVSIQRTMLEHASHVFMILDHSKLHSNGFCYFARWKEIHTLITTDVPDNRELCNEIRRQGTEVIAIPCPQRDPVQP